MSRRHHGRARHGRPRADGPRTTTGTAPVGDPPGLGASPTPGASPARDVAPDRRPPAEAPAPEATAAEATAAPSPVHDPTPAPSRPAEAGSQGKGPTNGHAPAGGSGMPPPVNGNGCTAPQLRRFIKSRPYVPMHELRRRFAIVGDDDDVTQVRLDSGHVYVGLPSREGALLGELLRGGEIGYELSLDPRSPIVVGVYPMRPVPRS